LRSIKSKIIVFAILATLIPSLGLGLLSFQQNETMISENVTRELRALAKHASRELDLWVNEHIYAARALSTSNIIINELSVTSGRKKNYQALAHYLHSVQEKLDTMLELTVLDPEGKIVASSVIESSVTTFSFDWSQHDALTQGIVASPPHWNTRYDTAMLSIAVPILSLDNFVLGALVIALDLHTIQTALKDTKKTPQSEVLLVNPDGRVMLASHVEAMNALSLDIEILERLQNKVGESLVFDGVMQQQVIGLAYLSEMLPITIVAERNRKDVYAAWVQQRNLFIVQVGVLLLIIAAVAVRMGHSIVVPLQRLVDATQQIVKGDLEVRLTVSQKDELGRLTQMFNQMADKLRQNQSEIEVANQTMMQKNRLLEKLSITDGLTGLYNRTKLGLIINDQLERFKRNQRPFAMLMMDVDYFKHLNDSLGHVAGDEILTIVAKALTNSIRSVDFAARYGGDEFIVVLTETTVDQALNTAERIRSQVANIHCETIGETVKVALSIGIIECESSDTTQTILLSRVDGALYEAKRAGRNRVYCIKPQN
jgi:diguanylate cyclase (GGDEF)-like protein